MSYGLDHYVDVVEREKAALAEFETYLKELEIYDCARGGEPDDYHYYKFNRLWKVYKKWAALNSEYELVTKEEAMDVLERHRYHCYALLDKYSTIIFRCDVEIKGLRKSKTPDESLRI